MAITNLTPLTLDELHHVAGGLSDPDKSQAMPDSLQQTTQSADGAAHEQTLAGGQTLTADTPQDRFDGLMQDFGDNHTLDQSTPQQISTLSSDIADGKLDAHLGTLVNTVSQLDATKDAPEFAKLAGALLDRFADFGNADRPEALAGLLDKPAFQPDKLAALSEGLLESDPRTGISLLANATQAFDDAGRSGAADTLRDTMADQLGDVLTDATRDGDDALADTIDWAKEELEGTKGAAWTMVDALLDAPANDRTSAALAQSLAEALKSDLDPSVAGRLLAEGVVMPNALAAGLLQNYDAVSDNPASFEAELKAIAADAGDTRADFEAIIRTTTFNAVLREAADGKLDAAEIKQAASLLLADRSLPASELPDSVLMPVFKAVGEALASTVNSLTFPPTMQKGQIDTQRVAQFNALAVQLHDLGDAGPAAIAQALVTMVQTANVGRSIDLLSLVRAVSDSPLATLVVAVGLATQLPSNTYNRVGQLSVIMATAVHGDGAVNTLTQGVLSGEIDAATADRLIADLATRSGVTTPGLVVFRQAELSMALIEAGVPNAAELIADLRADLVASPSPLLAAIVALQANIPLATTLRELVEIADTAGVNIGETLARVHIQTGVDIEATVGPVLAGLIANGELTAAEAKEAARSAFSAMERYDQRADPQGQRIPMLANIAAEMGEAGLIAAAIKTTGDTQAAAAELKTMVQAYRDLAESGKVALAVIREADMWGGTKFSPTATLVPQIIELLNAIGEAADVFPGSLFVDALTNLGNAVNTRNAGIDNPQWQYRDGLRAELTRIVTGNAAVQAGWVAALGEALSSGKQSAPEIVAELEKVIEHAFARQDLSKTNEHTNVQDASRLAMRAMWDGLDRMVAATATRLLDAGATSPAAREVALDWFRAQTPGGQAAILAALPATSTEMGALTVIAGQALDRFDWAAERTRVEETVSVGNYKDAGLWSVFKTEQARDDLRGAVELARRTGESQLDVILDMAKAWGVVEGSTGTRPDTTTAAYVLGAAGILAAELIKQTGADLTTLARGLALEVKTGEATTAQIMADIKAVVALAGQGRETDLKMLGVNAQTYNISPADKAKLTTDITAAFSAQLIDLGLPDAAAMTFLQRITDGSAVGAVEGTGASGVTELARLVDQATKLGVSVDVVLVEFAESTNTRVREAAETQLRTRIDSGALSAELAREVGERQLTATQALEVMRDAARLTDRSFGGILGDTLDAANGYVDGLLANAISSLGSADLARSIGADLVAGRLDAKSAANAVVEIALAAKLDVSGALSTLVSSSGARGAQAAAEAVKQLDDVLDSKGTAWIKDAAAAMDGLANALAEKNLTLAAADGAALASLADLFVRGGVDRNDFRTLMGVFDGTVPDAALVTLVDKVNGMADSPAQDELKYLVCERLAERAASGALFTDAVPELQAISRLATGHEKNVRYEAMLDMVEKATNAANYAKFYNEAVTHLAPAQAALAAAALVDQTRPLGEATSAYKLYMAADTSTTFNGQGFTQWAVETGGQANRDLVLQGMQLQISTELDSSGNLSPEAQAKYVAIQRELMQPELRAAEDRARVAGANQERVLTMEMSKVAEKIGGITERISDAVESVRESSAANWVLSGNRTESEAGKDLADSSGKWIVMAGSLAKAAAGGPASVAASLGITAANYLMQVEGFRSFVGEGVSATLDLALKAVSMAKSVMVAGVNAYTAYTVESAIGAFEGAKDMFGAMGSGDAEAVGKGLLKFADNLSALINIADVRGQLVAMRAAVEQAVKMINEAYKTVSEYLSPLIAQDREQDRKHLMGIAFL